MSQIPENIGPVTFEKVGRRVVMRFPCNDTIRFAIKKVGAKFEPAEAGGPYWWIGSSKTVEVVAAVRQAVADLGDEAVGRKQACDAGLLLTHEKTFVCKERLRGLGGIWDATQKGWVMPDDSAFKAGREACEDVVAAEKRDHDATAEASKWAHGDWIWMRSKKNGVCEYTGEQFSRGDWIWWSPTGGPAASGLETPPQIPGDDAIVLGGGSGGACTGWFPGQIVHNVVRRQVGYLGSAREQAFQSSEVEFRVDAEVGDAPQGLVARPYRPQQHESESVVEYQVRLDDFQRLSSAYDAWEQRRKTAREALLVAYPLDGPEWLAVVRATSLYIRKKGHSHGVGADTGFQYRAWCRAATEAEAAPAIAEYEKRVATRQLAVDAQALFDRVRRDGLRVPATGGELIRLGAAPIYLSEKDARAAVAGGGRWFVIDGDQLWAVQNNGPEGDASRNNIHTGGAGGATGWRIDLDAASRALVNRVVEAAVPVRAR